MLLDNVNFFLVEWCTILSENIVEPNCWLVCSLWWTPRIDGVSFSTNKSPIDCDDVFLMKHRDMSLELAVYRSCHIFSQDDWFTILLLKICYLWSGEVNICIGMYRNNIAVFILEVCELIKWSIKIPRSRRYGLARISFSCPLERVLKQRKSSQSMATVTRLIINIPQKHSTVILEARNNVDKVIMEKREETIFSVLSKTWCSYPLWVMNSLKRCWLGSKFPFRIPTIIKHSKHSLNSMLVSNT